MTEYLFPLICLLQPGSSDLLSQTKQFTIISVIFLSFVVVAIVLVVRWSKKRDDTSPTSQVRGEFEKSKDALLLSAQYKKATRESEDGAKRTKEAEDKEAELLKANVDSATVIGKLCPLCRMEMSEDSELIIDPYTGQGYHFSAFLNDWPEGRERPKYIYRYPQDEVVPSERFIRNF